MNNSGRHLLLAALCLGIHSPLARSAETEKELVAGSEKELATLRENISKKREAVAKAVNDASTAGKLKPSTSAYYLDALEKFTAPSGSFPEAERLYYPPRFDTSEDMEPINLAWTALREEMQRVYSRTNEVSNRYANAVSEELQKVARTAQKPEELDKLDQLFAAWEKIPESSSRVGTLNRNRDSLQRLASMVRSVLDGLQRKDQVAIANAFGRLNQPGISGMDLRSASLPFRPETFIEDFRTRVTAPISQTANEAQRAVEKSIMEGKSAAEVEAAIVSFQSSSAMLDRIRNASRNAYSTFPERNPLIEAYRGAVSLSEWLKSENIDDGYPTIPTFGSDTNYPISIEFRTYVGKLSAKVNEHRRTASARAQAKQAAEERDHRAAAEKARKDANDTAIKLWRGKLAGVRSPQEVLALADEVPGDSINEDRVGWTSLSAELRSIARWWMDASLQSGVGQDAVALSSESYGRANPFVGEVRAIRDRAMRDVIAKRLKLAQINEPPLKELGVRDALEKLSDEAAARGDWNQAHEIAKVLALRDSGMAERLQALRSFLTAQNLEAAGQYQAAADSYLQVIRTIGSSLPTKEAGERLKKLQAEHLRPSKSEGNPSAGPRLEVTPSVAP